MIGARPVDRIGDRAAKPIWVTSSTKMPSSGSSARMASRKPSWGPSLARRWRELGLPRRHLVAPRRARAGCARAEVDEAAQDRLGVADQRDRGRRKRAGSSGSASTRMTARSSSTPHWLSGMCRCVPMPSTASASRPQLVPERQRDAQADRGASSTPRPRRKASTGACSMARELGDLGGRILRAAARHDQRARCAAPSRLAAARIASSSSGSSARRARAAAIAAPARCAPQTSMAHSSAAGPGRPRPHRARSRRRPGRRLRQARGCGRRNRPAAR